VLGEIKNPTKRPSTKKLPITDPFLFGISFPGFLLFSSLLLATQTLRQYHFPNPSMNCIFNHGSTSAASILELGAGTGILPILLQQKSHGSGRETRLSGVRGGGGGETGMFGRWNCTDQFENLKLVEKNIKLNGIENVIISELDWEAIPPSSQRRNTSNDDTRIRYDAIISVDCLYNEALIQPFVNVLSRYTEIERTIVYVVVELRSSDVVSLDTCLLSPPSN
jgi:protein N-lysine methyltransferase METTL21D